jgi:hypothetical protein
LLLLPSLSATLYTRISSMHLLSRNPTSYMRTFVPDTQMVAGRLL